MALHWMSEEKVSLCLDCNGISGLVSYSDVGGRRPPGATPCGCEGEATEHNLVKARGKHGEGLRWWLSSGTFHEWVGQGIDGEYM